MILTVDSLIRSPDGVPAKALSRLRSELSFANPDYVNRIRFSLWVGSTPEKICPLDMTPGGGFTAPRGAVDIVKKHIDVTSFKDERISFPSVGQIPLKIDLRDYQDAASDKLVKNIQGCITVPCGGGKTIIALGAVSKLGQPTIFIVHTKDLLDQWVDSINECFGKNDVGIIGDGQHTVKPMTVAMVQTLTTMNESSLKEIGKFFGVCIVDEAHHTPAETFRKILGCMPAKYRFGLTATPFREDGLTKLIPLCIGPEVFSIGHKELVERGHLIMPKVVPMVTNIGPVGEDYASMLKSLVESHERNKKIVELVRSSSKSTLVLTTRVEHCKQISNLLELESIDSEPLHGKIGKKKRTDIMNRFRSGALKVLIATNLADEGLDISRLERVIIATPTRAAGRTIQRLGRLMRPFEGKDTPVLYDLIDSHRIARNQWAERRRAYRRTLGKDVVQKEVRL